MEKCKNSKFMPNHWVKKNEANIYLNENFILKQVKFRDINKINLTDPTIKDKNNLIFRSL